MSEFDSLGFLKSPFSACGGRREEKCVQFGLCPTYPTPRLGTAVPKNPARLLRSPGTTRMASICVSLDVKYAHSFDTVRLSYLSKSHIERGELSTYEESNSFLRRNCHCYYRHSIRCVLSYGWHLASYSACCSSESGLQCASFLRCCSLCCCGYLHHWRSRCPTQKSVRLCIIPH